mgnify:CR=1 FL=1
MYAGLKQMDALLPAAREKVNAELGARFAELCQQHKFFYILAPAPTLRQTYAMAICSLMEMQWQHCCYIHSGEYFHGPFEATEPACSTLCSSDRVSAAPLEERALAFLNTHTDTIMVLDALEYGVGEVPASVRSYLEPIFFYNMSCELRAARGKVFNHSPRFVATWASSSTNRVVLGYRVNNFSRRGPCQARVPFALRCPFLFVGKRSLILFREVNDLFWTPKHRHFLVPNRRKILVKPQEMVPIKCRCFGGSFLLVHFSGKVLDLNLQACHMSQKAGRAGDFRARPALHGVRMSEVSRQPADYFASYASASHQSSWAMLSRMCWQLLWKPSSSCSERSSV